MKVPSALKKKKKHFDSIPVNQLKIVDNKSGRRFPKAFIKAFKLTQIT
jgi:hypothetical protein